jgi:DNA polymerase-3 subunit delta'
LTAENAYDLLPTIRSRAAPIFFSPLSDEEMRAFAADRRLDNADRRIALAGGSPGVAMALDLEQYDRRRSAMFALLRVAAGAAPFAEWMKYSEGVARGKSDKLESYLKVLYMLLRDVLLLREGGVAIRNPDIRSQLEPLARKISFDWILTAVKRVDDLAELLRRNIQKTIALDALILELRGV